MRVGEARDIPLCILQRDADALDLGEPCIIEMVEPAQRIADRIEELMNDGGADTA